MFRKKLNKALAISGGVWVIAMSLLWYAHYYKQTEPEIGFYSSDVRILSGNRKYYAILQDGQKIGYSINSVINTPGGRTFREEVVLKLNLSGISREVFMQCTTSIDSLGVPLNIEFNLISGKHHYVCNGRVEGDSLMIDVRSHLNAPWRRGGFETGGNIVFTSQIDHFLHSLDELPFEFIYFDPFSFTLNNLKVSGRNEEYVIVSGKKQRARRFEISSDELNSTIWIDDEGHAVLSEGNLFHAGIWGNLTIEENYDKNVFLLPVKATLGSEKIRNFTIVTETPVINPRLVTQMSVGLDGIRAAVIDTESPHKTIVSFNPLVFDISSEPKSPNEDELAFSYIDSLLVGSSDYIQVWDARIVRTAREITSGLTDTLYVVHALNEWVHKNVEKSMEDLVTRAVDILRIRYGGPEEHTKLLTALTRSMGIPTRINLGLVYEDDRFVYHCWPTVLVKGEWLDLDPFYGQARADAARIVVASGDFDNLIELLRVFGRFSINIKSFR